MTILYTIGFTKKSAKSFFETLQKANISLVADVRLNNTSQLSGFTKKRDLEFFLSLVSIDYEHWTQFAPTKEMRTKYHMDWNWEEYERSYRALLKDRDALDRLDIQRLGNQRVCLLCSEPIPDKCHRRIAAEVIAAVIDKTEIIHL